MDLKKKLGELRLDSMDDLWKRAEFGPPGSNVISIYVGSCTPKIEPYGPTFQGS